MPDEEDLEIHAALAQSPAVRIVYLTDIIVESGLQFSRQEIEAFANCFMLAPLSVEPVKMTEKAGSQISFGFDLRTLKNDLAEVPVGVSADGEEGIVSLDHPTKQQMRFLHPETAESWVELLLANPRLSAELRNRLEH